MEKDSFVFFETKQGDRHGRGQRQLLSKCLSRILLPSFSLFPLILLWTFLLVPNGSPPPRLLEAAAFHSLCLFSSLSSFFSRLSDPLFLFHPHLLFFLQTILTISLRPYYFLRTAFPSLSQSFKIFSQGRNTLSVALIPLAQRHCFVFISHLSHFSALCPKMHHLSLHIICNVFSSLISSTWEETARDPSSCLLHMRRLKG